MAAPANPKLRHFTTRRGFVVLVGLLVLTLYFVWAVYGAAPTSLSFLSETRNESMGGMAMGGHGTGTGAMTQEEIQERHARCSWDFSLPDGSVRPTGRRKGSMAAMGGGNQDREDAAGGHRDKDEASGQGSSMTGTEDDGQTAMEEEPVDVYLMAMRFSYMPRVLRLEKGVPYRFRMMSMDVNHGASIHTGFAGHIMRRPARTMVEMVMTFSSPGEFMMYCTVYCGEGHSQMKGKLIVQ